MIHSPSYTHFLSKSHHRKFLSAHFFFEVPPRNFHCFFMVSLISLHSIHFYPNHHQSRPNTIKKNIIIQRSNNKLEGMQISRSEKRVNVLNYSPLNQEANQYFRSATPLFIPFSNNKMLVFLEGCAATLQACTFSGDRCQFCLLNGACLLVLSQLVFVPTKFYVGCRFIVRRHSSYNMYVCSYKAVFHSTQDAGLGFLL